MPLNVEELEDRGGADDGSRGRGHWGYVPGSVFGFLGIVMVVFYGGALLFGRAGLVAPVGILQLLYFTFAAGVAWCAASISWFKRYWWIAIGCSLLGMVLLLSGLSDR